MKKELLRALFWLIVTVCFIVFVGFPGHDDLTNVSDYKGRVAGFGMGLVHGFLSIISVVVSLFNKKINIYEVHNNGVGYNLGFVLGIILWIINSRIFKGNGVKDE